MNIFYIRLILGVVISLIVVDLNAQTAFYLRDSRPWNVQSGQPGSNEKAMDKVFQNNWQTVIYSNANPNVIFSSNTHFVFLEGSDTSANALNYFLTSNRSIIEQWVFNGGRLLINAAPNQGGHIDFGFNGVTLQYPSFTPNAVAVDGTHAVFNGPHGSTGTSWSGNWFGHAAISGTGLNALIRNSTNNEIILAEKKIGSGIVLFGGMTLQHYHSPKPQVYNLRANILEYLNSAVICVSPTLTVPALQAISSDLNTCGATVEFTASATGTSPDISYSIDIEGIDTEIYSPHFFPIGSTVITASAVNDCGTTESKTFTITVEDITAPVVDAKSAVTVTLDSSGAGSLAVADVLNSASTDACGISSEVLSQTSFGCTDVGTFNITLTVKDVNDNETMKTVSVTVVNDTPILSTIIGPTGPQPVNSLVTLSATVTDINPASAQFYFSTDGGDSFGQPIDVGVGEQGNIIYYFTPQEPQVYLVKLVVTDICGLTAVEEFRYVVIFDPNGGFVTGGGTIWSPAGAFKADNTIEGPANFGFNAKYKSGKNYTNEVDGSTNFQFKAGNFHFKSTSHEDESLVVSGGFKATYKGYGTVNGNGNYQFLVTVIDADQTTNYSTDLYRIKIWDGNGIAYDNNLGNTEDNADPAIAITGGSIVIHKPKGGGNQKEQQEVISAQSIESVNMLETMSVSPNPVVSTATVSFSLNMNTEVALEVFDYSQRRVKLLYNGKILSGQVREVVFDREGLPSGTYFVKLTASNGQVFSKQIIIN